MSGYDSSRTPAGGMDPRQSSGPMVYDRYTNFRTRSSSPDSLSRRMLYHSRDVPSSRLPAYHRDEYPNVYRPNIYRPNYDNYHVPDHYEPHSGTFTRDRASSWSSTGKASSWVDRRASSGSGPSQYVQPRRDADMLASRMAPTTTRLFEPSDAWKQSQQEPRHTNFRPGGDRYRPANNDRDSFIRSRADVYRPRYDDSPTSRQQDSINGFRRDSGSRYLHASSSRPSNSRSRSRSLSTSRSAVSPARSPGRGSSMRSQSPYLHRQPSPDIPKHRSRSSSAFSVASSRPSLPPPNDPLHGGNNTINVESGSEAKEIQSPPETKPDKDNSESIVDALGGHSTTPASRDIPPEESPEIVAPSQPANEQTALLPLPPMPLPDNIGSLSSSESLDWASLSVSTVSEEPDVLLSAPPTLPKAVSTPPAHPIIASEDEKPAQDAVPTTHPLEKPTESIVLTTPLKHTDVALSPKADSSVLTSMAQDETRPLSSDPIEETDAPVSDKPSDLSLPNSEAAESILPETFEQPPEKDLNILESTTPNVDETQEKEQTPQPRPVERPTPDDIPNISEADSMKDVLRIVVMTRLLCDKQTREERVGPILNANHQIPRYESTPRKASTAEELVTEMQSSDKFQTRLETFEAFKPSLVKRFEDRQAMLLEKVQRLRNEYIDLHEKWLARCAALDEQAKPSETEAVQPSGRTTRRTANLGDAVRSDLEMEQIIASLGNDDATDPNHLSQKNLAIIPDMISVTHGGIDYAFDDTNHLVTDPHEYYAPRTGIDDWTSEEKSIFCDKFAAYPKQFGIIADYLPNKSPAQCVAFYYLHKKKFIDFRKVIAQLAPNKRRRRRTDKQKGNALLTDIRRHDAEIHRDSESPSSLPQATAGRSSRRKPAAAATQTSEPSLRKPLPRRSTVQQIELTPTSTPTPEPDGRSRRRRNNNNINNNNSQLSVTTTEDAEEEGTDPEQRPAKKAKRSRKVVKSAAIVSEDTAVDDTGSEPPSTRQQSSTPFQLPPLSEEQQKVVLGLIADYMNPATSMTNKNFAQATANSSKPPTPDVHNNRGYPGGGIIPPTVGTVRYGDAAAVSTKPQPSRASEQLLYPGAGIMSPVMNPATITPMPQASRFMNGDHTTAPPTASSSRISFHANPWVQTTFSAGTSRVTTPQPPGLLPQPPLSSSPYAPMISPLPRGGGRHLDSPFVTMSGVSATIPDTRSPVPAHPLARGQVDSLLSLSSFTATPLPMTSPGPSTSLERAESRLYQASGPFVPMSMTPNMTPSIPSGSSTPRGQNPYPVVPPPYNTSYNLPR